MRDTLKGPMEVHRIMGASHARHSSLNGACRLTRQGEGRRAGGALGAVSSAHGHPRKALKCPCCQVTVLEALRALSSEDVHAIPMRAQDHSHSAAVHEAAPRASNHRRWTRRGCGPASRRRLQWR